MSETINTNNTLALRYRPHVLEDIAGHADVVKTLSGMFKTGNVPNAIALVGPSGVGKTTFSRIIARYLNCEHGTGCGKCDSCKAMDNGSHPDYKEINAAESGNIDTIRQLIEMARLRPRHKVRVIMMDEAHRLTLAGSNALLKPLEEPPPQTLWIIATTDPEKIPNSKAIMGRCAQLVLHLPTKEQIGGRLLSIAQAEDIKWLNEDTSLTIAEASNGHVRDAVQILDSVNNHVLALDRIPRGRRLTRLIEDLSVKSQGIDVDKLAMSLLLGIYTGDAARVQSVILDAEDHLSLVNKAMYLNYYLVGTSAVGKHAKLWSNRINQALVSALKDKRIKLTVDNTSDVHSVLTRLRSEMQGFLVGAEHLMTMHLTRLAVDYGVDDE